MNIVILTGNLTRDPEVTHTSKGVAICKMGLAVNERRRNKQTNELIEEVHFFDLTAFGKTAENCGEYLKKGRPILVEGKLRLEQWEDKNSGQRRSKVTITANNVQFLGGRNEGGGEQALSRAPQQQVEDDDSVPF